MSFYEWHPEMEHFFEGNYELLYKQPLDLFPSNIV